MQITFWGVRGSYPVPGPSTIRYGGHTSCIEVRSAAGHTLIVDAGTGLRELGNKLAAEQHAGGASHYHILLSHVHWDHIQGLPFFPPAYIEGTKISIYALRAAAEELKHVIAGITRQEFFPVPLDSIPATFEFHEVKANDPLSAYDFDILPLMLNHPFGAVGYRIHADRASWAYVCDTAPFDQVLHKQHFLPSLPTLTDADRRQLALLRADLINGLRGTDTVVFDTHFLPEEYERFPHWGHSTPDHALALCNGNDIRQLVLYHHAPSHSDQIMDQMAGKYRKLGAQVNINVVAAHERMSLKIGTEGKR